MVLTDLKQADILGNTNKINVSEINFDIIKACLWDSFKSCTDLWSENSSNILLLTEMKSISFKIYFSIIKYYKNSGVHKTAHLNLL